MGIHYNRLVADIEIEVNSKTMTITTTNQDTQTQTITQTQPKNNTSMMDHKRTRDFLSSSFRYIVLLLIRQNHLISYSTGSIRYDTIRYGESLSTNHNPIPNITTMYVSNTTMNEFEKVRTSDNTIMNDNYTKKYNNIHIRR